MIPNAVGNSLALVPADLEGALHTAYATTFLRVGGSSLMAYQA